MSEYCLEIKGNIELSDYSNISDYMELVDSDDRFSLRLKPIDEKNTELICSMLQDKYFHIQSKTTNAEGETLISAIKLK